MPVGAQQFPPGASAESPLDSATARLAAIWCEVLGLESVGPDENYFDLGGDSSLAVELFARIERELGSKPPLAVLFEAPTVRLLATRLANPASLSPQQVVPIQPHGAGPALFLLHDASGDVFGYRNLARRLSMEHPVYGIRSVGLDGQTTPPTCIEQMAAAYIPAIRSVQPTGPYFLAGYCGGGTLAYEVAQQLVRVGEPVAFLGLLDTSNWSALPRATVWSRLRKQLERLNFHFQAFAALDGPSRRRFWQEKVKILRARVPVWRDRLKIPGGHSGRRPVAAVWAANDRACALYTAQPYPGKVTEFRPQWQYRRLRRAEAGWGRLAAGGSEVRTLSLYPATMLVEPYVAATAAALQLELEIARRAALPEARTCSATSTAAG